MSSIKYWEVQVFIAWTTHGNHVVINFTTIMDGV